MNGTLVEAFCGNYFKKEVAKYQNVDPVFCFTSMLFFYVLLTSQINLEK